MYIDDIKINNFGPIEQFPYEECEFIELKEIKGSNPCSSIIANAEIYINAYLNSKVLVAI